MAVQTDSRTFLGLGAGIPRDWVYRKWTGPIAAAVNVPQASVAGALLTDPNPMTPVIYPFVADGTMRPLGFALAGYDNTNGQQGDGPPIDIQSCSGRLPDKNTGGGNAITYADAFKPVYLPDNGSCSKLAADGVCGGMILGISPETGEPVVLIDPVIAQLLSGTAGVGGGRAVNLTAVKTANYTAQLGEEVRANPTGGAFAVNLPAIAASNKGLAISVKNVSASGNAITITPAGADTIDGAATLPMTGPRQFVTVISDGTSDWLVK